MSESISTMLSVDCPALCEKHGAGLPDSFGIDRAALDKAARHTAQCYILAEMEGDKVNIEFMKLRCVAADNMLSTSRDKRLMEYTKEINDFIAKKNYPDWFVKMDCCPNMGHAMELIRWRERSV